MPWVEPIRRYSLRKQLIATYAIALLIATAGVATLVVITVGWNKNGLTSKGLMMQARWIEQALQFDPLGRPIALATDRNSTWVYQSAPQDLKYRVLSASGQVLLASDTNANALTADMHPFDSRLALFKTLIDGLPFYVLTVPLMRPEATLYVQVARSERIDSLTRRTFVMPVVQVALWVETGSLILFGLAVYITVARTVRTLRATSAAASRIEPGNLSKRLDTSGLPAEMKPLVDAFNLALGRLERGYRVQQEFLAGAAHELKTPLALIRAQVEMDTGPARPALLRDVDLMARQVQQLLHLAEVSEAQNYVFAPTDLASVAGEVSDHLQRLAEQRHVLLRVLNSAGGATCNADRSAVFVLIKNLIENAIRHSPVGGAVILEIKSHSLEVRDAGEGIGEADFPLLFNRFWRGAGSRDAGAGLGLAICREIANVHGWSLEARNVRPGAAFTVSFQAT